MTLDELRADWKADGLSKQKWQEVLALPATGKLLFLIQAEAIAKARSFSRNEDSDTVLVRNLMALDGTLWALERLVSASIPDAEDVPPPEEYDRAYVEKMMKQKEEDL